jgi:peptide-methionine (R)-S-oxide reductase
MSMKLRTWKIALLGLAVCSLSTSALVAIGQEPQAKKRTVTKTDAEWLKQLTRDQYIVTRQEGTEPAFSGKLLHNKSKGIYECICCDTPLFSSKTKFDSGTGWPSFYAPYEQANIDTAVDFKMGYARKAVMCNTCGSHLGHVFDDGPAPTGLRFCMNSVALKFVKDTPPPAKEKTSKTEKTDKKETPAKDAPKTGTPAKDAPKTETPVETPK